MKSKLRVVLAVALALCSMVALVFTFLFFDIAGRWFAIAFVLCQSVAIPCFAVGPQGAFKRRRTVPYAPLSEEEICQIVLRLRGVR